MEKFPLNKVDYYDTFEEFLQGIVNHYGDKPAISYFTRNKQKKSYTYRELRDQVFALREMLCILGLSGKKIGIVGVNSYQWIVAYLAIASCGSVAICVDIDQSDNNIRNMLRLADADVAFVSSGYLDICKPLLNTAGGIEKLLLLDYG
ncbi:MAG: AMP-binding protein, partial [Clostridiales bacterium]